MKIAYIIPSLKNTGPIIVVHSLTKYLLTKQHKIDIYYFDDTKQKLTFDCPCYCIKFSQPLQFDKYDIIHSHCFRSDIYVYKWRNKIKNSIIISTIHQDTFELFKERYNYLIAIFITKYWYFIQSKFDGIICISDFLKNQCNRRISTELKTIYNGCSIEKNYKLNINVVEKLSNIKKQFKVLGSYAFITKGKGLQQVISILNKMDDYAFVIIGDGPFLEKLKQMSYDYGVENRVFFLPYTTNPYKYLQYFDVYMMPSYSEGFGLAMVEAALHKKAIVCSELPSFKEIFTHNEVSFFELNNKKSLLNAIDFAYCHKNELGHMAYNKAKTNFTAEVMSNNHLLYYNQLLKNKHKN